MSISSLHPWAPDKGISFEAHCEPTLRRRGAIEFYKGVHGVNVTPTRTFSLLLVCCAIHWGVLLSQP